MLLLLLVAFMAWLNVTTKDISTSEMDYYIMSISGSQNWVSLVGQGGGYIGASLAVQLRSFGLSVSVFDSRDVPSLLRAQAPQNRYRSPLVLYVTDPIPQKDNQNAEILDILSAMLPTQHFLAVSVTHEGGVQTHEGHTIDAEQVGQNTISAAMLQREKIIRDYYVEHPETTPRISILRLGSLVGQSPSHCTHAHPTNNPYWIIPTMFVDAYTRGVIRINGDGVETSRAYLSLEDLGRALRTLICFPERKAAGRFELFHLASFNAKTVQVANSVASITGARVEFAHQQESVVLGSSADTSVFRNTFDFKYNSTLQSVLNEMERNIPASITPTGPYELVSKDEEQNMPCPVCGSRHHQDVLDIGTQPFANDFQKDVDKALESARFPLKLVRCKVCNHLHLSHLASRDDLFDHYLYQSATSRTLAKYFDWLADKIIRESGTKAGSILEIACNDGTQLNFFKKAGWQTFGVDPAANLVPLAVKQGHKVKVGYWGADLEFPELPKGNKLNAIVAQNVFAHVPDNVAFLKKCVDVMGSITKLYIQTSQCHMHQLGQFDTAYHEHISFFTAHSFQKAAELAGLVITNFEVTPIHGTSCLVTMMLPGEPQRTADNSTSLKDRLALEVKDGITSDYFYQKYEARAHQTRRWIVSQLNRFREHGYQIIAYGAAAKGMVLLHFFMESPEAKGIDIEFIVDDAELKQNTYCAGTRIPVRPTSSLRDNTKTDKPTVVLVLAWNFWAEIAENIKKELSGYKEEVMVVLPFPTPRVVRLRMNAPTNNTTLLSMPFYPALIPNPLDNPDRRRVVLIMYICDDELSMLRHFIVHHAHMFDYAIVMNKCKNPARDMILSDAPVSWELLESDDSNVFLSNRIQKRNPNNNEVWALKLSAVDFVVQTRFRESVDLDDDKIRLKELCMVPRMGENIDHGSTRPILSMYHDYFASVTRFSPYRDVTRKRFANTRQHNQPWPGATAPDGFVARFGCPRTSELVKDLHVLDENDKYSKQHHAATF